MINVALLVARNDERRRLKALASPAPWRARDNVGWEIVGAAGAYIASFLRQLGRGPDPLSKANAEWVAYARADPVEEDVDALLAALSAAEAQLSVLKAQLSRARANRPHEAARRSHGRRRGISSSVGHLRSRRRSLRYA